MCGWGRGGWGLEARAKVVSEAAHVSERHARCAMYRIHGGVPQSSPKYTVGCMLQSRQESATNFTVSCHGARRRAAPLLRAPPPGRPPPPPVPTEQSLVAGEATASTSRDRRGVRDPGRATRPVAPATARTAAMLPPSRGGGEQAADPCRQGVRIVRSLLTSIHSSIGHAGMPDGKGPSHPGDGHAAPAARPETGWS